MRPITIHRREPFQTGLWVFGGFLLLETLKQLACYWARF